MAALGGIDLRCAGVRIDRHPAVRLLLVLIALLILSLAPANVAGIRSGGDFFLEVLTWGSPLLLLGFLIGAWLAVRLVSQRR
jgi:hypothetical protein